MSEPNRAAATDSTIHFQPTSPNRFPIRLNCPHCRNPVAIVDSKEGHAVACPSCGSSFQLDADRTQSWQPEKLPTIGRFQLVKAVGRGAFGTVYRAQDTQLSRIVALKIPRSGTFSTPEDEERFIREARHAAQLNHAGIVQVFDVSRTAEFPFIVSEFIAGVTLADVLTARRFGFREAAELAATISDALHHAHEHQVIHRDLKPSNIMVDANGQPRIMDFGLAKRDAAEVTMTIDGSVLGTPAYMSPEQARGQADKADRRADIYSLGVILFELLTGERPFRGNSIMLLHQVAETEPPRLRDLNNKIPLDLDTIVAKCLEKAPEKRYSTSKELGDDLRRHLGNEPILARPIGLTERAGRWCKRNPLLVRSAAAIFTVLAVALAIVSWSWRNESIARTQADILAGKNLSLYEQEQLARRDAEVSRQNALQRLRDARSAADLWLTVFPQQLEELPGGPDALARFLEQAARDYERFAQQENDDPQLELERGRSWLRLGDVRKQLAQDYTALTAYEQAGRVFAAIESNEMVALEARIELATAEIGRGLALQKLGRSEESESRFSTAISLLAGSLPTHPDEPKLRKVLGDAHFDMAVLQFRSGKSAQARASAQSATSTYELLCNRKQNELSYRAALAKANSLEGELLLHDGQLDEARKLFEQSVRQLDSVLAAAPDSAEYFQARAEKHVLLATALRRAGALTDELAAYQCAVADYEEAISRRPGIPSLIQQQAIVLVDTGNLLHYCGQARDAEEPLIKAIGSLDNLSSAQGRPEFHEQLAAARAMLGEVYRELNKSAESERLLRSALNTYGQLAVELPQTIAYVERGAVTKGQLAQTLALAGETAAAVAMLREAIDSLSDLIERHPEVPGYRHEAAYSHWHLGEILMVSDKDEARRSFVQARDLWTQITTASPAPEYADAFGWFLVACSDPDARDARRAIALATEAHRSQPANHRYRTTLSAACFRDGQFEASTKTLNELVEGGRATGYARFFLAMALAKLGQTDQARGHFHAGQEWQKTHEPGNALLERLHDEARALLESGPLKGHP